MGAVNRPKGARHDSVGPLLPYIEARIVDDKHNDVNPGDRGEVWLRGPNMITAYHNNKKATDETLTPDGWLRTGDVGYFIDDHLYLVDRTKELIKYKAFQVPPAELEALLLTCELVADAAVIGSVFCITLTALYVLLTMVRQFIRRSRRPSCQEHTVSISNHPSNVCGVLMA